MTYEQKLDYLLRYRLAVARVQELSEDIARLQAQAERTTLHLTGMPGGRGHDRFSRIEDCKEDKEHQLARLSRRLSLLRSHTQRIIRAAPLPCRQVLTAVYIDGLSVGTAAIRLGISRTQAYRLRREGVNSIPI